MEHKTKKLYTTVELAEAIGVTQQYIRELVQKKKITPSYKMKTAYGFTKPVFDHYVSLYKKGE